MAILPLLRRLHLLHSRAAVGAHSSLHQLQRQLLALVTSWQLLRRSSLLAVATCLAARTFSRRPLQPRISRWAASNLHHNSRCLVGKWQDCSPRPMILSAGSRERRSKECQVLICKTRWLVVCRHHPQLQRIRRQRLHPLHRPQLIHCKAPSWAIWLVSLEISPLDHRRRSQPQLAARQPPLWERQ